MKIGARKETMKKSFWRVAKPGKRHTLEHVEYPSVIWNQDFRRRAVIGRFAFSLHKRSTPGVQAKRSRQFDLNRLETFPSEHNVGREQCGMGKCWQGGAGSAEQWKLERRDVETPEG